MTTIQLKGLTDEQNGYLRALNELSTLIERIAVSALRRGPRLRPDKPAV